jgi:hypothetical protein
VVGQQQVVVADVDDGLAGRALQRAVAVVVGVARALGEVEDLEARGAQRAQRVLRAVRAAVAEDDELLGPVRLGQDAARREDDGVAPVVRGDRDRERRHQQHSARGR